MTVYAACNGERLTGVSLWVPEYGPWFADLDFEAAPEVTGQATLTLGELSLVGNLSESFAGTSDDRRRARLVAGAGGWGTLLAAKAYHNDAGVKARTVAEDAAREAGETLGDFALGDARLGADYVRQAGPASRVLEDVAGEAWFVDYAGVTQVTERESSPAPSGAYDTINYDPRARLATMAPATLDSIGVGTVLSEALDAPQAVRELEVHVSEGKVRLLAWTGEGGGSGARLVRLMRAVVERASDGRLWGKWRYRVVRMSVGRVELQAISKAAGLPDILPISMRPGIPGAHGELTPGSVVLVEFVEGDRSRPIVTGFEGIDGQGFMPQTLHLVDPDKTAPGAVRVGDTVEVLFPPMVFVGTINGLAATGVVSATLPKAIGNAVTGSSRCKVGA